MNYIERHKLNKIINDVRLRFPFVTDFMINTVISNALSSKKEFQTIHDDLYAVMYYGLDKVKSYFNVENYIKADEPKVVLDTGYEHSNNKEEKGKTKIKLPALKNVFKN